MRAEKKIPIWLSIAVVLVMALFVAVWLQDRHVRMALDTPTPISPERQRLRDLLDKVDDAPRALVRDEHRLVTYADFQSLQDGTPYDDVVTLLGRPGRQLSRSAIRDAVTASYEWTNPDGSTLFLVFQSAQGGLTMKSQHGLQ